MTVLKRPDLAPLLARFPFDQVRLMLFAGPDEAGARDAEATAAKALADPDDPLAVTSLPADSLKADPGRLADEAAAVSMFGTHRLIRVDGATDANAAEAVQLLLAAPAAGNTVLMLAGDLPRTSALRKAAETAAAARLLLCYPLEQREARHWAETRSRALGLSLAPGIADRLFEAAAGDIGIIGQELEKLALFLAASPAAPRRLEAEQLAALGAAHGEEDLARLTLAVVAGQVADVGRLLAQLPDGEAIRLLRALARRLLQLADLRAAIDSGAAPEAAARALRPPIFWKEQQAMAAAAASWSGAAIAAGIDQLLAAEAAIKAAGSAGEIHGRQAVAMLAAGAARGAALGGRRPRA